MPGKSLEESFESIRERIEKAAGKARRNSKDIKLIAVSKKQPDAKIQQAIKVGQLDFGENYVQELLPRIEKFSSARWHFIGNLQRNKCKYIVGKVALIHSVDRIELAQEINKVAIGKSVVQPILIQINMGNEETKGGIEPKQLEAFLEQLQLSKNLEVQGLMALPPVTDNPEDSRGYFRELKNLSKLISGECEISAGTSHDFEIAIEEGASIVRVGTSLFGEREYK